MISLEKISHTFRSIRKAINQWPRNIKLQVFLGATLFLISVFLAVFASVLTPYGPLDISPTEVYQPPGLAHLLGTDAIGRDVLSRVAHGARVSLLIAIIAVIIATTIGSILGVAMGYIGGKLDMLITLPIDALWAIPGFLIALVVTLVLGGGLINTGIAVGLGRMPTYYRTIRSIAISLKEEEFITAEVSLGASKFYIIFHHIFPLCIPAIVVISTVALASGILSIAGLGFLGLGVPPPTPEWGSDIARGRAVFLSGVWWPTIGPSIFLFLTVLGFNMFGESLSKVFGTVLEEV